MAFTVSMKIKSKIEYLKTDMQMKQRQIRVDHIVYPDKYNRKRA